MCVWVDMCGCACVRVCVVRGCAWKPRWSSTWSYIISDTLRWRCVCCVLVVAFICIMEAVMREVGTQFGFTLTKLHDWNYYIELYGLILCARSDTLVKIYKQWVIVIKIFAFCLQCLFLVAKLHCFGSEFVEVLFTRKVLLSGSRCFYTWCIIT